MLNRCSNCVMPDTRPHTIFKNGMCQACINYKERLKVDWNKRFEELKVLCDKYRRKDGYYDCIIPVSGGKDSHMQTYILKEKLGMNPLLVCVADPFTHTQAGTHNLRNLSQTFDCDVLTYTMSLDLFKRVTKIGFEELREPFRFVESVIYTIPYKYAVAMGIPLVFYGENSAYLYGSTDIDDYNANKYVEAGHSASGIGISSKLTDYWVQHGISVNEMNCLILPEKIQIEKVKPQVAFMSYFIPWDDEQNVAIAKRYGFKDLHHEWQREGVIEDYAQIDSLAYMVHIWTKFPKFGFQRVTDIASRWVRKGKISRDEALQLVRDNDCNLDQRAIDDFCSFMGYTQRQFWDIIEMYWNKDIFENINGVWSFKK